MIDRDTFAASVQMRDMEVGSSGANMESRLLVADRRAARRSRRPLHISCLGVDTTTSDWSVTGLKITNFAGPIPFLGEVIDVTMSFLVGSLRVTLTCEAEVVRYSQEEHMLALHFFELPPPEADMLSEFAKYEL